MGLAPGQLLTVFRLFFLLAIYQLQLLTLRKTLPINGSCHVSTEHDTFSLLAMSVCRFPVTHSEFPAWGLFFSILPLLSCQH